MKLYVARHGETTWNAEKRVMGTLPGELSEKGHIEARQLGVSIQNLTIDIGFVSDLNRAVQTADAVTLLNPSIPFSLTPALRERHLGDLEGKLISEFDWDAFWEQPEDGTAYNSESLHAFSTRVAQFLLDIESHEHETVLLITHQGTMNRLHYFMDPDNFEPQKYPNAEIVEFNYSLLIKGAKHFLNKTLS